jgi:uroporphyrin-III C-methyltransferase
MRRGDRAAPCAGPGGTGAGPGRGIVYLVGAGPGDPGLITVRGLAALRSSEVVVYDRLVHPALLGEAPPAAERIFAGKAAGHHAVAQQEIHAVLVDRARAGRIVTRLKGGDPFVFGRGGEECEALRRAGVRFEVVPGVTSAVAVPAAAGIPVTHRRYGSAFAVVSGHACGSGPDLDWSALARLPVLVVLMGLRTLPAICDRLLTHGASASTPAAVVSHGTLPQQRTVTGTLATIAGRVRAAGDITPPSVLIVGDTVRMGSAAGSDRVGTATPGAGSPVGPSGTPPRR